jgi:PHD/YefM family antitoxin component YafN of YafNO toxin-antitoxin module
MNITHQTVIGENGRPEAAIIPWSVFLEIQSLVEDGEATPEELAAIREAEADRKAGNADAFTDLQDLKAELSL